MSQVKMSLSALVVLLLTGCSFSKNIEIGEQYVANFHLLLSKGQIDEIMLGTSAEWTEQHTKAAHNLLINVQSFFGFVISSEQVDWGAKSSFGGKSTVTLIQDTTFENGSAKETFVLEIVEGTALLYSYNIKLAPEILKLYQSSRARET